MRILLSIYLPAFALVDSKWFDMKINEIAVDEHPFVVLLCIVGMWSNVKIK